MTMMMMMMARRERARRVTDSEVRKDLGTTVHDLVDSYDL